jgi:hypothetical protein
VLVERMAEWIIFYDDGTSFSSEDGDPGDAPRSGVQVIVVKDISCGRYCLAEQNFYCWEYDQWIPRPRRSDCVGTGYRVIATPKSGPLPWWTPDWSGP